MGNLAILVDNKNDSTEAQDLLFSMGYKWRGLGEISKSYFYPRMNKYFIFMNKNEMDLQMAGYFAGSSRSYAESRFKEITLPELRDLVVLKRNSIDDATHEDKNDPEFKYRLIDKHWYVITEGNPVWRKDSIDLNEAPLFIKPIEKPMKEYLRKNNDGEYILEVTDEREAQEPHAKHWIEIPEGATYYAKDANLGKSGNFFFRLRSDGFDFEAVWLESNWMQASFNVKNQEVLWQRTTHPEELPFIDDEPSLNDQYAEIEKVRQDIINSPNHYADSTIECIDAMEAMMTPEQFIGYLRGNVFKYQWRYEKKNGIEDLKKAKWYLERLTEKVAEKNAPF